MMLEQMMKREEGAGHDSGDPTGTVGQAVAHLDEMQLRVKADPISVTISYVDEVKKELGVSEEEAWALWHMTGTVVWGKMLGLRRVHHHVSHIAQHLVKEESDVALAYVGQLLRALHQVAWDKGAWTDAYFMLWAAPTRDLGHIAQYRDQMWKLRRDQKGWDWNPKGSPKGDKDKDQDKGGKGKGDEG
jgi:hypothetical protein